MPRDSLMRYWEGSKRSARVEREHTKQRIDTIISLHMYAKGSVLCCPLTNQDLSKTYLEQEFLLTLMT